MRLRRWVSGLVPGYRRAVPDGQAARRVAPIPKPADLDRFAGMWVAVVDGEVVATEHTSHRLAVKLREMDHRRRKRATVEYVRPASDSYIIGVG
jgi:hypothetical protein